MKINVFACILTLAVIACSCSKRKASISVLCEKDAQNNYVLKWEIYPEPSNNSPLEIYSSSIDTVFLSSATKTVKADDYISGIDGPHASDRMFFKIKADNTISGIITNRFIKMDSVHNFRDIGGYYTEDGRQIRWGRLYRSGSLAKVTPRDRDEINKLGIKTILDLRSTDSRKAFSEDLLDGRNYVRIPIGDDGFDFISPRIMENRFFRGDAIIFTQDTYRSFIDNYTEQFAKFFDYLCDRDNYPIVADCYLGKDQTGMATYLLLRVLDVPSETAEEDYMLSNMGVKRPLFMEKLDELSESKHEVITMMSNTDLAYLRYGLSCIRKKYGSVDEYMAKGLNITPEKRRILQDIFLYNNQK